MRMKVMNSAFLVLLAGNESSSHVLKSALLAVAMLLSAADGGAPIVAAGTLETSFHVVPI